MSIQLSGGYDDSPLKIFKSTFIILEFLNIIVIHVIKKEENGKR